MLCLVIICGLFVIFSLLLCGYYLFNYLVILENFNVLILFMVLVACLEESRMLFMSMMALFVLEISIMLMIIGLSICGDSFRLIVGF